MSSSTQSLGVCPNSPTAFFSTLASSKWFRGALLIIFIVGVIITALGAMHHFGQLGSAGFTASVMAGGGLSTIAIIGGLICWIYGKKSKVEQSAGEKRLEEEQAFLEIVKGEAATNKASVTETMNRSFLEKVQDKIIAEQTDARGKVAAKQEKQQTFLHMAAELGHIHVITYLFEQGANLSAQDENGNTPLHLASRLLNEPAMLVLKQLGAPNLNNDDGRTPDDLYQATLAQVAGEPGHQESLRKEWREMGYKYE